MASLLFAPFLALFFPSSTGNKIPFIFLVSYFPAIPCLLPWLHFFQSLPSNLQGSWSLWFFFSWVVYKIEIKLVSRRSAVRFANSVVVHILPPSPLSSVALKLMLPIYLLPSSCTMVDEAELIALTKRESSSANIFIVLQILLELQFSMYKMSIFYNCPVIMS